MTSRTVALAGGLFATSAAVFAQAVTTDNSIGASSVLLGSAGLIAAVSAFAKDFWTDRQKKREHEIVKLKVRLRASRNTLALQELYAWARAAHGAVPALPPVPELVLIDDENKQEKGDA